MDHPGRLVMPGDDQPLSVVVGLSDTHLSLHSGGALIGRWPLDACKVEVDGGDFSVQIEGDRAGFVPDHPAAFAKDVLARWPPARLADAVRAVRQVAVEQEERTTPVVTPWWSRWAHLDPRRRVQLGSVAVGLILVLALAVLAGGRQEAATPITVPTTTTTPTPGLFELGLDHAVEAWNDAARRLGVELFIQQLPQGPRFQVALTERITLYATSDRDRSLRTIMIAAAPAEDEAVQQVLAAWGVLLATTNPGLTPVQRRDVLSDLGVNLDAPLLLGIDRSTTVNGVRYWLQAGLLTDRVHFGAEQAR
jgi:hypothetical protein